MTTPAVRCLACAGDRCEPFLELTDLPVFCNVLHTDADEARNTPRGDLELVVCRDCGHVFNAAFDPARIVYSGTYENSLHHSPRFQKYADELIAELTTTYGLGGSHVVEIASGQGDFLRQLCAHAGCRGTGYDPSFRAGDLTAATPAHPDAPVRILAEPFDRQRLADLAARGDLPALILCRQALEHFAAPHAFLVDLGAALSRDSAQPLFFEVPNALYSLQMGGIWDFIYEHVSYFNAHSLARIFARAGFAVTATHPRFGGQFLSVEATWQGNPLPAPAPLRPGELAPGVYPQCPPVTEILAAARSLASSVRRRTQLWRERLGSLAQAGKSVVVWGAGSKGVTFLNLVGETGATIRLVDINPAKHGMYAAGSGIRIEKPEALSEAPPALVLVMNPLYTEEIKGDLQRRGIRVACEGV